LALADTDRRVGEGKPVAPSFMLACMLWHDVQSRWDALRAQGEAPMPALQLAIDTVFDARIGDISGRGKLATDMREIWMMQPRFERRNGRQAYSLVELPRFRAGFDFLRLRADAGEAPQELGEWWEDFSMGDDAEREALVEAVRGSGSPVGRDGSRGRRPVAKPPLARSGAPVRTEGDSDNAEDEAPEGQDDAELGDPAPARKRRRRRRKPAGSGGGASANTAPAAGQQDD
jgi:poly(A) polymerase